VVEGVVRNVSADSSAGDAAAENGSSQPAVPAFKALVELGAQELDASGFRLPIAAGMQVTAEIRQGRRTVFEYLLSPVERTMDQAGRER
jgi:hemolysin D